MSILDAFDPLSPEVIRPTEMFQRLDHCPEFFIVPFITRIIDCLLSQYGAEQIGLVHGNLPVCRFDYRGHILGCYPTQLGGPASVCLMEDLIAKGAKKFLFFGSCGALDESLAAGHLIIPSEAYRDEGTSYHYLPPSDYVEIPTAPKLKAVLDRLELPNVMGRIWTTDAFFRETADNCRKRREDGCIAVDMECASLAAASQFREVEFYQFLYAADCVGETDWNPRCLRDMPSAALEKYLRIALEAAIRL